MASRTVAEKPDDLFKDAQSRSGDLAKTGRYIITFKGHDSVAGASLLRSRFGLHAAISADFADHAVTLEGLAGVDALLLSEINVAIVGGEAYEEHQMGSASMFEPDSPVYSVDPEYFAFSHLRSHTDYLQGFARAAHVIASDLEQSLLEPVALPTAQPAAGGNTWGLSACGVPESSFSGNGIKVAILDTGLDFNHPDFVGRAGVANSFVGTPPQDVLGHGTHTTGTACGPMSPLGATGVPRYGIAFQAAIFIGKVLSDSGVAVGGSILAGMNWAIANGCQVISMSLSGPGPVQAAFTNAGSVALSRGGLMIAAAGNNSHRPAQVAPTGAPANSPSIMSVAAVDQDLQVAPFSSGGKVDIAAPGVNVLSSVPRPVLYSTHSGTSMAAPHVAGVATLIAESDSSLRGTQLWSKLQASARSLPFSAADAGAGLVQAPLS